ncbi:type II toxin-antitoxin system Phd/YefM family antitoxin [Bacteroidia bacterium]|nr:type II toxin-antitoxin system Phd/YefM family antitoxin [Bacteroidia bacterium]
MNVVNYTDLRVINDVEELIIKRKNNKDLVLISLDEYNSLKETNYLLSGKNRDVLIQSIQQAEEGNVSEQELIEE